MPSRPLRQSASDAKECETCFAPSLNEFETPFLPGYRAACLAALGDKYTRLKGVRNLFRPLPE